LKQRFYQFIAITIAIIVCWGVAIAPAQAETVPLTLDILQQRLDNPVLREGSFAIDLEDFSIDLREENPEFRDRFYELLRDRLAKANNSLGLDLSGAIVRGMFDGTKLGLRTPLYGEALSPLFSAEEKAQIDRDRDRLSRLQQLSQSLVFDPKFGNSNLRLTVIRGMLTLDGAQFVDAVNFANTFFLDRVEAKNTLFSGVSNFSETRFSKGANFIGASFTEKANFQSSIFFDEASFDLARFCAEVKFGNVNFQDTASFHQAQFDDLANFSRSRWQENGDFSQTIWDGKAVFNKANFSKTLFLTDTQFNESATFRQAKLREAIDLQRSSISNVIDFSDLVFANSATLNVSGLTFDSEVAQIAGDPGNIGKRISVSSLQGNENLLRKLVRNFRNLEQISDANAIDYLEAKLRSRYLDRRLFGVNLNTASYQELTKLGLTEDGANNVINYRQEHLFGNITELLELDAIDLASYLNIRDRIVASEPISILQRMGLTIRWLGVELLLLASGYGTNFSLALGLGILACAGFALLFWFVDRFCNSISPPQFPSAEITWTIGSFLFFNLIGGAIVWRTSPYPIATIACVLLLVVPLPALLLWQLYRHPPTIQIPDCSYFVEDGRTRELRLTIVRLPTMARFGFFHDLYMPVLVSRRWSWLNYYDLSLNNWFKVGFNDIRLRDRHLPGAVSALVWYQWALGLLYITLLLWTLSRTIPGLNLLLYLK